MIQTTSTTLPPQERHIYKVPFPVIGNLSLIFALSEKGVVIHIDKDFKYACACFDNTYDLNTYKKLICHSLS